MTCGFQVPCHLLLHSRDLSAFQNQLQMGKCAMSFAITTLRMCRTLLRHMHIWPSGTIKFHSHGV